MTSRGLTVAALLSVLLSAAAALPAFAQVRVGPLAGYSLLERTDTSLSHGPLHDEATAGRTVLVGAVLDARVTERDQLSLEFVIGPYHNDVDRYCIDRPVSLGFECAPEVGRKTSYAFLADLQYARIFGESAWRPYAGGGFGLKAYRFTDFYYATTEVSPAILMTAGVRAATARVPVRIEGTALFVPRHPILNDKTQFELQARIIVPF